MLNCSGVSGAILPSGFLTSGIFKKSLIAPSSVPSPNTYLPGFKVFPSFKNFLEPILPTSSIISKVEFNVAILVILER